MRYLMGTFVQDGSVAHPGLSTPNAVAVSNAGRFLLLGGTGVLEPYFNINHT